MMFSRKLQVEFLASYLLPDSEGPYRNIHNSILVCTGKVFFGKNVRTTEYATALLLSFKVVPLLLAIRSQIVL